MSGALIGPEYDQQIRQTIIEVRRGRMMSVENDDNPEHKKATKFTPKHGQLLDDLDAAVSHIDPPKTARCRILRKNSAGSLSDTEIVVTVANRLTVSYSAGEYVRLRFLCGEWTVQRDGIGEYAWGILLQDSGKDDSLLTLALYRSASLNEFIPFLCGSCDDIVGSGSGSGSGSGGDCSFLDMDLSLCDSLGEVLALVPAGYKAGPVGMIKMPVCGPGGGSGSGSGSVSAWQGWTVLFGRRMRCMAEIGADLECCATGLQFIRYKRIWYFGGELPDRLDPCPIEGSGSGSGS